MRKQFKVLKVGIKDSVIGFSYKDKVSGTYTRMEVELTKKLAQNLEYNDGEFEVVMTATRTELLDLGEVDSVIVTLFNEKGIILFDQFGDYSVISSAMESGIVDIFCVYKSILIILK
ncbi:MAG: hypothetical protein HFE59_10675 [Clostridiales bacterium]|nr:hypothetical protein [Clostridiales bacterium]